MFLFAENYIKLETNFVYAFNRKKTMLCSIVYARVIEYRFLEFIFYSYK